MNQMKVRPPREIVTIEEKPNYDRNEVTYVVKQEQSLADNVLVVGERYQPVDLKSTFSCYLGRFTSGVMGNFSLHFMLHRPTIQPFSCSFRYQRWNKNM